MLGQEDTGKWLGLGREGDLKEGKLCVLLNLGVTGHAQLPNPNKPVVTWGTGTRTSGPTPKSGVGVWGGGVLI